MFRKLLNAKTSNPILRAAKMFQHQKKTSSTFHLRINPILWLRSEQNEFTSNGVAIKNYEKPTNQTPPEWKWDEEMNQYYRGMPLSKIAKYQSQGLNVLDEKKDMVMNISDSTTATLSNQTEVKPLFFKNFRDLYKSSTRSIHDIFIPHRRIDPNERFGVAALIRKRSVKFIQEWENNISSQKRLMSTKINKNNVLKNPELVKLMLKENINEDTLARLDLFYLNEFISEKNIQISVNKGHFSLKKYIILTPEQRKDLFRIFRY